MNMFFNVGKKVMCAYLIVLMCINGLPMKVVVAETDDTTIIVQLNGKPITFSGQEPILVDGNVLVPLRDVLLACNGIFAWDSKLQTMNISYGENNVVMTVGATTMMVNMQSVPIDVAAQIINGRVMASVKAIAKVLDTEVLWDEAISTVSITGDIKEAITSKTTTPKTSNIDFGTLEKGNIALGRPVTVGAPQPPEHNIPETEIERAQELTDGDRDGHYTSRVNVEAGGQPRRDAFFVEIDLEATASIDSFAVYSGFEDLRTRPESATGSAMDQQTLTSFILRYYNEEQWNDVTGYTSDISGHHGSIHNVILDTPITASIIRLETHNQPHNFRVREIEVNGSIIGEAGVAPVSPPPESPALEPIIMPLPPPVAVAPSVRGLDISDEFQNVAIGKRVLSDPGPIPPSGEGGGSDAKALVDGLIDREYGTEKWFVELQRVRTSYAIIDFEELCEISYVVVYSGFLNGDEMLTDFFLQYEEDGEWINIPNGTASNVTEPAHVVKFNSPITTSAVRIQAEYPQNTRYRVREIEVYGKPTGQVVEAISEEVNPMTLPIQPAKHPIPANYSEIKPVKTDDVLINPGSGWALYGLPDTHTPETMSVGAIGYERWHWNTIEPNEGDYRWELIDHAISEWERQGKKFAFRVMVLDPWNAPDRNYQTPKWVFDAGAKFTPWEIMEGEIAHVPVWDDPIYMEKLTNFTNAVAERYDGHPKIAFYDMGGYGYFGENHVWGVPNTVPADDDLLWEYIQIFLKAFKKTPLLVPIGHPTYYKTYLRAIEAGAGVRHDGVVNSLPYMGQPNQGNAPTAFEFTASFRAMAMDRTSTTVWSADRLRMSVETYYPSYIGMGHWSGWDGQRMYHYEEDLMKELANRMGYWFSMDTVAVPKTINAEESASLIFDWRNAGVTYLYEPAYVALALLDNTGEVVQKQWALDANPQKWNPHAVTTETYKVAFNEIDDGEYQLAVGLFLDKNNESPDYKLANKEQNSGWYLITDNVQKTGNVFEILQPKNLRNIDVRVQGEKLSFDQPPVIINGRTMVPLRGIFEAFGAQVQWEQDTETATAILDETTIMLRVGSDKAEVNGNDVGLDQPMEIINGRTLVPIRFISEAVGFEVEWNQDTLTVAINVPEMENFALNSKVIASHRGSDETSDPQSIVDGEENKDTGSDKWLMDAPDAKGANVIIDFGEKKHVRKIDIYNGQMTGHQRLQSYTLQYDKDGTWVDIPNGKVVNDDRQFGVFDLMKTPIHTSKIRLISDQDEIFRIREIKIYGMPNTN